MVNDEDPTPQPREAPLYLRDFAAIEYRPVPPARYLPADLTASEHELLGALDREGGEHAPMVHVAKLAVRLYRVELVHVEVGKAISGLAEAIDPERITDLERWAQRISGIFKSARKFLWTTAVSAALSLAGVGTWLLHRGEQAGAETQRIINLEYTIQGLKEDIRELRAAGRQHSDAEPTPPGGAIFVLPDKIAFTDTDNQGT